MQERKNRPDTGDKDDEQGFENVTVPPVGDINTKLAKAIKQVQSEPKCSIRCTCPPCKTGNCSAHIESARYPHD